MRGALTQAGGFTNIQTDIANKTCEFHYTGTEAELSAKLDELAKNNSHIRDWKKKT